MSFNDKCSICNKTGFGPCLKCENKKCSLKFHVECARINKYHMECHTVEDELKYFIYCQLHRPLQFLKIMEIKNTKKKEEVVKYGLFIEKLLFHLIKSKSKPSFFTKFHPLNDQVKTLLNKKRKKLAENPPAIQSIDLTKIQAAKVNSKIKEIYNKLSNIDIYIKYKEKTSQYEVSKKYIYPNIQFKDIFDKNIFPWYLVTFNDVSPRIAYTYFGKICSDESTFKRVILGITADSYKNKKQDLVNQTKSTNCSDIVLYCYCKRQYNEENVFMIGCSNEDNCKYKGWFHPQCVDELKGMTKEEIEDENFNFTCRDCKRQMENQNDSIDGDESFTNDDIKDKNFIYEKNSESLRIINLDKIASNKMDIDDDNEDLEVSNNQESLQNEEKEDYDESFLNINLS